MPRRQAQQRVAEGDEKRSQAFDAKRLEFLRQQPRQDQAVLDGEPRPRWPLSAVGEHDPAAIRSASQVRAVKMQPLIPRHRHMMARQQEARMPEQQIGRQHAAPQQFPRPVDIGQQPVEQHGALLQAGFHPSPFVPGQ